MSVTPVTLGEGRTPLLRAPRLSARLGVEVWLKLEGLNPTGSFKDRGMALAVTRAVEQGAPGVVCASTGNTAASAAAYAARAGIAAAIVVPAGAVAGAKLAQVRAVGARVVEVEGSFTDAYEASLALAEREGYAVVNSVNEDRIEGQRTAALEIVEELGGLPDALLLPYGGGGNTKAYARGFLEAAGRLPRLHPAEAERRADTFASAIRIVEPVHRAEVEDAVARSGGAVVSLSEERLERAWRALGAEEGVFCEPASAAGVAALERGVARAGERVVCVITGHGLKDADAVRRVAA
ncbi:MAG: threonine synthase [Thermoleophilia bacterium]|nr:threonine synthase [Thermoleophilia bacterium]